MKLNLLGSQTLHHAARGLSLVALFIALTPHSFAAASNQYYNTAQANPNPGWSSSTSVTDWAATAGTPPYNNFWTSGNIANFEGTAGTVTVDAANNPTAGGITFNVTGYTLTGGTIKVANNSTIKNTITTSGSSSIINSIIADSSGVCNITLSGGNFNSGITLGANNNTFSGTTTITACKVSFATLANGGNPSSFGQGSSTVGVVAGTSASAGSVTCTGSGGSTDRPWTFNGTATTSLNSSGSGAINFNNTGLAVAGTAGARTVSLGGTYTTSANTFAEQITDLGTGANITTLTVGGNTWNITGANTHSGGTTLGTSGLLNIGNSSALGTGTFTVSGNGSFDNTTSGDITVANAFTLSASPTYVGSAHNMAINGTVTLSGATRTITVSANTLTLGGQITGAQTLTKAGSGTLVLNNPGTADTHNGTTVSAGTLDLGNTSQSLGAVTFGSGSCSVQNGTITGSSYTATVTSGNQATISAALAGGGGLTYSSGTGTLILSGANSYAGDTMLSSGGATLKLGASDVIPDGTGKGNMVFNPPSGTATLDIAGVTETINGLSSSGAGSSVVDNSTGAGVLTVGNNDATSAFAGVIKNSGGTLALTKVGAGTLTLSGANLYSGDTTITAGTLKLGASNVIPDGSGKGNVVFNPSSGTATLDVAGLAETINGLSSSGAGTSVVDNSTGSGSLTVGNNNVNSTYSGVIQNSGGSLTLTKTGTGALSLFGVNTYSGGTAISGAGALFITNDAAIGSSSGGLTFSASGILAATNNGAAVNNPVTIGSSRTITVNSGVGANFKTPDTNNLIIAAKITGAGGVNKSGSSFSLGTVRFSNDANDFTGDFSVGNGNTEFTSVANQGTPSSLGAGNAGTGGAIAINNGNSSGVLRYVGSSDNSTMRSLNWTGQNIYTIQNNGNGKLSFLSAGNLRTVASANSATLTLSGANNLDNTFAQVINDDTSATAFTKSGAGKWILTGVNTYSGITSINAGELVGQTGGSCANSAVTVSAGATNGVKVAAAGGQWSCNGLTCNTGTTYADFDFNSFAPSTSTAPLNVGPLTVNGTLKVLLRNVTIPATIGNYPLIHYTGTDPSVSSFSLNAALPLATNAVGGLVVDSANKNVAVGVKLVGPNATFTCTPGTSRIISISDLVAAGLASAQVSPAYHITVATPANGGYAATNSSGTMMKYTNSTSATGSDTFNYTVSDGTSTATATVTINFTSAVGPQLSQSGTDQSGNPMINFHGIPNYTYHMQRSTDLANWTTLQPGITCDGNGNGTFTDTNTPIPNTVYYRLIYP